MFFVSTKISKFPPISAQFMTSGVKGLNQQNIRGATQTIVNNANTGQQIQLLNISQRPRGTALPVVSSAATPITAKQFAARGLVQQQRNLTGSTLKSATPINGEF